METSSDLISQSCGWEQAGTRLHDLHYEWRVLPRPPSPAGEAEKQAAAKGDKTSEENVSMIC